MLSVKYIPMQYYDAIIICFTGEDGSTHNIIVDGGDKNSRKFCYIDKLKKELELIFGRGESIDLWVITHIDNDHIGGLYNFINDTEFFDAHHEQLKEVWMNYGGKGDFDVQKKETIGYYGGKKLRDLLKEKHVSVKHDIIAGLSFTFSDAKITVVTPDENAMKCYKEWWNNIEFKDAVQTADGLIKGGEWDYDDKFKDFNLSLYEEDNEVKNNSSIAFVLSYHGYNLLFSADSCSSLLSKGLKNANMLKEGKFKFDIVHIPHHGSCRNSSLAFLNDINCPRYVITGNGANRHHLPDKETIARLIAANPMGCELHFTQMNFKLKEIFTNDNCKNMTVIYDANFTFE